MTEPRSSAQMVRMAADLIEADQGPLSAEVIWTADGVPQISIIDVDSGRRVILGITKTHMVGQVIGVRGGDDDGERRKQAGTGRADV